MKKSAPFILAAVIATSPACSTGSSTPAEPPPSDQTPLEQAPAQVAPPQGDAAIAGFVYEDRNRNQRPDEGEPRLAARTVRLHNPDATVAMGLATTSENGNYLFEKVAGGDYRVTVVVPEGWERTSDDSFVITLPATGILTDVAFGMVKRR